MPNCPMPKATFIELGIYPVQDREEKNNTLSGGTSSYGPYEGVPPHSQIIGNFNELLNGPLSRAEKNFLRSLMTLQLGCLAGFRLSDRIKNNSGQKGEI